MDGAPDRAEGPTGRIVLFDGVCVFCDGLVRWLIARDPGARLRFAPLQGPTADALRSTYPEIPDQVATLVYVDATELPHRIFLRSEAAFRLLGQIESPWRRLTWFGALPRWFTDLGYQLFVRIRYRVFGKRSECRVPSPSERARFLD